MDIQKNTENDKRKLLRRALESKFQRWLEDYDDSFLYFEKWDNETNNYETFKVGYSISDDLSINIAEDPSKVIELTEYKDVAKGFVETLDKMLTKHFGSSSENTLQVIKQFDEEQMIAIEPMYVSVNEIDGQGDIVDSLDEMENLVKSFNEANAEGILQSSLFHKHKTDSFSVIKAWVNPCECMIGDTLVPETQPIVKIQFKDKKAWKLRKQGVLMGLSIGARASEVEIINE